MRTDALRDLKTLSDDVGELTSIKEILEMAIRREASSYDFYMMAHQRACQKADRELFRRLAEEELTHKQNLQRQLEEVQARIYTDQALSGGEIGSE